MKWKVGINVKEKHVNIITDFTYISHKLYNLHWLDNGNSI